MPQSTRRRAALLSGAAALALVPAAFPAQANAAEAGPRNIILLISDGAGYNQFDATNFYRQGSGAFQLITTEDGRVIPDPANTAGAEVYMQSDWIQVAMAHASQTTIDGNYDYSEKAWEEFEWVKNKPTDSAAAGTALSTGAKTYNGILGYDAAGAKLTTAGETALASGRKLGLVTSVPFNHATPAAFIAHNQDRNDYTGLASEMLSSGAHVLMGGGHPKYTDDHTERDATYTWIDAGDFSSLIGGKTPYTYIEERSQFDALAACEVPESGRVFGLAQVAETLQERRAGGTSADVELGVTPLNDVPTLETMTEGALNTLTQDSQGFYLMVEGGAIDWAGHSNFMNHLIEEQTDFNAAVDAATAWVEENSSWEETLVIVTADHETGYLAGLGANPEWTPMAGEAEKLPEGTWHSTNHTNALVPLFAKGAGAQALLAAADQNDSVRGAYLDNTEVGRFLNSAMSSTPVSALAPIADRCAAPTEEPADEPQSAPAEEPAEEPQSSPSSPTPHPQAEASATETARETASASAKKSKGLATTGASAPLITAGALGAAALGGAALLAGRRRP